jgi:hypothetical protein
VPLLQERCEREPCKSESRRYACLLPSSHGSLSRRLGHSDCWTGAVRLPRGRAISWCSVLLYSAGALPYSASQGRTDCSRS